MIKVDFLLDFYCADIFWVVVLVRLHCLFYFRGCLPFTRILRSSSFFIKLRSSSIFIKLRLSSIFNLIGYGRNMLSFATVSKTCGFVQLRKTG